MEIEKYGVESNSLEKSFFAGSNQTASVEEYLEYCEKGAFSCLREIVSGIEDSSDADPIIVQIRDYINEHYSEKLDLSDIARNSGLIIIIFFLF